MNNPNDLLKNNDIPYNISVKLKASCYDCHSNETIYPWYSYIAPLKWMVYNHTKNGREELNFSDWNSMKKLDMVEILDDIASEVVEKEMPLKLYPFMHPQAKLNEADRQAISDWAEMFSEDLFE